VRFALWVPREVLERLRMIGVMDGEVFLYTKVVCWRQVDIWVI
jgi:hypothetical protein